MDRLCQICQTLTYEDELTSCNNCGAELPPVEEEGEEVFEEIDELETLDLGDLDLDDDDLSEDTSPTDTGPADDEAGSEEASVEETPEDDGGGLGLDLDLEEEGDPPEGEVDTGDWDAGAIGGDVVDDSLTIDDDNGVEPDNYVIEMDLEESEPEEPSANNNLKTIQSILEEH